MTDLAGAIDPGPQRPPLVRGVVSRAPADETDELEVTIDSFDGGVKGWRAPFTPRPASGDPLLPEEGDDCLVAFDEVGNPWVIMWQPAG